MTFAVIAIACFAAWAALSLVLGVLVGKAIEAGHGPEGGPDAKP